MKFGAIYMLTILALSRQEVNIAELEDGYVKHFGSEYYYE